MGRYKNQLTGVKRGKRQKGRKEKESDKRKPAPTLAQNVHHPPQKTKKTQGAQ